MKFTNVMVGFSVIALFVLMVVGLVMLIMNTTWQAMLILFGVLVGIVALIVFLLLCDLVGGAILHDEIKRRY